MPSGSVELLRGVGGHVPCKDAVARLAGRQLLEDFGLGGGDGRFGANDGQ